MKRKPLLYDEFMANTKPKLPEEVKPYEFLRGRMSDAKVFTLDDEAVLYMANMIRNHPDAIALDQEFSIPPFRKMFVEFPYTNFFKAFGGTPLEDGTADERLGYFYDGPRVYVLAAGRANGTPTMTGMAAATPVRFRLNQQFKLEEELAIIEAWRTSRLSLDSYFWGSVYNTMPKEIMRALRAHHSFEFWYAKDWFQTDSGMPLDAVQRNVNRALSGSTGDLRNIIAIPLFLNRTADIRYEDTLPGAPAFVHAKPRTLVRHSVIKLKIDPAPMLKKIYGGHGSIWRREHDVRGHWCHDKTWREHKHEHQVHEYDVNQWRCMACGGLKWWRKEHRRGKKEMGVVKQTYEVHA